MIEVQGTPLGCPNCKRADGLQAIESLLGTAPFTAIRLSEDVGDDPNTAIAGNVEWDWSGDTEVVWDTSETIGIACRLCGWEHRDEKDHDWSIELVGVEA